MAQQPLFRPYTGGIQPIQGQIEAGARIGQSFQQGLTNFGNSLSEGIKEYNKNSALNDQAAAEAESSAGELMRMMGAFADSPEYAPFVAQYSGLLEKAKKAPTMGMTQRLSLANELKSARQSLGSDLQLYEFGKQKRLENIARQGLESGVTDGMVSIGTKEASIPFSLRVDQNVSSQIEAYRRRYAEISKQSKGSVKPFDIALLGEADNVRQSIAKMNAPEDLKANALKEFDAYVEMTKRSSSVLGYAMDNPFGPPSDQQFSSINEYYTGGMNPDDMLSDAFKYIQKEETAASIKPSPAAQTKEERKGKSAQQPSTAVEKLKENADVTISAEQRALNHVKGEQIKALRIVMKQLEEGKFISSMQRNHLTDSPADIGRSYLGLRKDANKYSRDVVRRKDLYDFTSTSSILGGELKNIDKNRRELAEDKAFKVVDDTGDIIARAHRIANPIRAFSPSTWAGDSSDSTTKLAAAEFLQKEITRLETSLNAPQGVNKQAAQQAGVPSPTTATTPATTSTSATQTQPPATARAVPTFGVARLGIGPVEIMAEKTTEQRRDALRKYVAGRAGFNSSTVDSVVNNILPSTGPDIREIQTPSGKVITVMGGPDGKWTQLTTPSDGKSFATFGTKTATGQIIPKTYSSPSGKTKVSIAGEFEGSDADAGKFREGVGKFLVGVDAADRLMEIVNTFGRSMPWNPELQKEAAGLVASIQSAIRLDVVGTGVMSNYDMELLQRVIANPTDFLALTSGQKAQITASLSRMKNHLATQGQVYGLDIQIIDQNTNQSEEAEFAKKYATE